MSLIRQIWSLLLGMVVVACAGSLLVWMVSARGYLETQLQLKNSDNAQLMALSLSQLAGDPALMELAVAAQFDTGYYRSIRLVAPDGRVLIERTAPPEATAQRVPQWFVALVPIGSPPGIGQVSDGWRPIGTLEVISHSSFAHSQLWRGGLQTASWLLAAGVLAGLLGTWGVRRLREPLRATEEQAQALVERRFVTVPEPSVPELARLTRAMNAVVARLKAVFDEQAQQVETLRVQAHVDAVTGVSARRHFLAQFTAELARPDGDGRGRLFLVRLMRLADVNRELGHQRTDRLLRELAQSLQQALQPDAGERVGRLNGGDFGLVLRAQGGAEDQGRQLANALRRVCVDEFAQAELVLAGMDWQRGMKCHELLASADEALARAEVRGGFAIEIYTSQPGHSTLHGEDEWRRRISTAVAQKRVRLARLEAAGRDAQTIFLLAPLELQLDGAGGYEAPDQWQPLAIRTGLMPAADEMAVGLALEQIAADGFPRCVRLASASLVDSGYLLRLRALLAAAPRTAKSLRLAIAETAAVERFELVRELCKQLRPFGVQVGLSDAGERLTRLPRLVELGLDFVLLEAGVVDGVASEPVRAAHVRSMTSMLHGLGLQVYAERADGSDLVALWDCGVDGSVRA